MRFVFRTIVCFGCVFGGLLGFTLAGEKPIFETDIQPVLAKKCGQCHSDKVQKGALDLSSMEGLLKGGESGESAVGKSLDESLLWAMVDGGGMPPDNQPQLSKAELEVIQRWISTGASSQKPAVIPKAKLTQHDVLPIVLLRCTTCHGPRLQEGGLDLRTPKAMLRGGKSGPAIVPGSPDQSLMIERIESEACPPREKLLKFFVRRPAKSEVETLRNWIAAGAPQGKIVPDVATTEPDRLVTDEDREHWAFQPPKIASEHHSLDEFVLAKLQQNGLEFSPLAGRDTLIRRAYFDLIGLPPTVDEWQMWKTHPGDGWYEEMIEHLLASPHYGERWGRYWLDLAGYADSEGGVSADPLREVAWKYRDYVVRSFNSDKPYHKFLREQLAGDEIIDPRSLAEVTPELVDNLIATGFLRMGIDQTGSRTMNFVPERLGVINDAIKVIGSSVMGLTLECARCHSHKYDPFPHRDYYRFKAIFQGAFDEHDWLTFKNRKLSLGTPDHVRAIAETNPPFQKQLKSLESELRTATADLQLAMLRAHYPEQSEDDRRKTLRALKIADNVRSQPQRILVEKLQTVEALPDTDQPASVLTAKQKLVAIEDSIATTKRKMVAPLTIRAVWDRGEPSPTYILRRGEHDKPGPLVGPGVPSMLTDGKTPFDVESPFPGKTGRRLAFARWLTHPDHPLTARVIVNRVWYHHFGTGLVRTLENFGRMGEPPSHLELLDWLAITFVERGWSLKELHRLIMNSRTYRQSSVITKLQLKRDPQNRLLSRMPIRRMNAEAVRDSLLFVSGKLDPTSGGIPDDIAVDRNGQVSAKPTSAGKWRRSLYLQYRRTEIPSLMETFDYPEMGPNCVGRNVSTVSPQSLLLMNNARVRELASAFANRVRVACRDSKKSEPADLVRMAYRMALSREPSEKELILSENALKKLEANWGGDRELALETYCHTLLNSAAFLYAD